MMPALPTASALVNLILTAEACMPLLLAALEHAADHVTPEGSCPACQAAPDGALCADHADDRKRADEYTLLRAWPLGEADGPGSARPAKARRLPTPHHEALARAMTIAKARRWRPLDASPDSITWEP